MKKRVDWQSYANKAIYTSAFVILVFAFAIILQGPVEISEEQPLGTNPIKGIRGVSQQPTIKESAPDWINKDIILKNDKIYVVGSFTGDVRSDGMVEISELVFTNLRGLIERDANSKIAKWILEENCNNVDALVETRIKNYAPYIEKIENYQKDSNYQNLHLLQKEDYEGYKNIILGLCGRDSLLTKEELSLEEVIYSVKNYPPQIKAEDDMINILRSLYSFSLKEKLIVLDEVYVSGKTLSDAFSSLKLKTRLPVKDIDYIKLVRGQRNYGRKLGDTEGIHLGVGLYLKKETSILLPNKILRLIKIHSPKESYWILISTGENFFFTNIKGDITSKGIYRLKRFDSVKMTPYIDKNGKTSLCGIAFFGENKVHSMDVSRIDIRTVDKCGFD